MFLRFFYISVILIFFNGSCREKLHESYDILSIDIPLTDEESLVNLSEIIDSLSYIRLETNSNCLIGNIDKMMLWQDKLFIADKENTSSVFVFDRNGKFVNKINNKGHGRGEYVKLSDVTVDSEGSIFVLDGYRRILIKYSSEGQLSKVYKLDFAAGSIASLENNKIAFYCDFLHNNKLSKKSHCPNLIVYDLNTEEIQFTGLYFDKNITRHETLGLISNFSLLNDFSVALLTPLDNTIYNILSDSIKGGYYLNLGREAINSQALYIDKCKEQDLSAKEIDDIFSTTPVFLNSIVSNNMIYSFYKHGINYYYGFYYPKQGIYKESCVINDGKKSFRLPIKNDIDGVSGFAPLASDGDNIYYTLSTNLLIESKQNIRCEKLRDIANVVSNNDNPLIVCGKLKK